MSRVSPGDRVRIADNAARVGSIAGGKLGTVAHVNRDTALVAVEGHGARLVVDLADLEPTSSPAPMDVLAAWANDTACPLDEANRRAVTYAAVAELVEAAKEAAESLADFAAEHDHYPPPPALANLRAALAKFGGA